MLKKLLLLVGLLTFGLFLGFSYFISLGRLVYVDFNTTVRLQNHLSRTWDLPFSILSLFGAAEITGVIWLLLVGFLLIKRRFWSALLMGAFWIGLLFELVGKIYIFHPEPPHMFYRGVFGAFLPKHYVGTNYSYPSGHMIRTGFLITFVVIFLLRKGHNQVRALMALSGIALLIIMFVSRIYLGEHWLSDVIGGSLLGISLGIVPALFL